MRSLSFFILISFVFQAQSQEIKKWSLQECINYALEHNINIQQNDIQTSILENNLTQSKWNRAPNLNGSASHNYNIGRTIDPFTNTFVDRNIQSNAFSLTSGLTLYSGNRLNNGIKQNTQAVAANEAGSHALENQIRLAIASAYLQIIQAKENLTIAQSQFEISESQLIRANKLVAAGAENLGVVYTLQAQKANDQVQLISAENQIELAYVNLYNLLQISADQAFEVESINIDSIPEIPTETSNEVYDIAISAMPEVRQAELNVFTSELNQKVLGGARLPTLSAYGNLNTVYSETGLVPSGDVTIVRDWYGYYPGTTDKFELDVPTQQFAVSPFGQQLKSNFGRSVGFQLSVPVFNNFRSTTAFENAKLNTQLSELNLIQTKNQLRSDVSTAYTSLKAAKSRYDAALLNEQAQFNNYSFNQKRFDAGVLNSTDLMNSKNYWSQSQNQLISAKYEYLFRYMIIEFYKGNYITL